MGTRFLRSLASLDSLNENATIEVRIFKVPSTDVDSIVVSRERRTHNKFMVSEKAAIIGRFKFSYGSQVTLFFSVRFPRVFFYPKA
ncbi:hypothetical protein ANCCEY_15392 [Ancylostoma ceylanicum]|uniref:Uncharacterized protein n=1 Tax=Ancylostoma ceylanicum TaxID=53326 RepID=A0A0D6L3Y5_9BILA|nr:hypothetical protein ANCCEY_15392 [Ancylostoma ceylanicum]